MPLVAALQSWVQLQHAPFHTPGHKQGQGASPLLAQLLGSQVFQADLPELPGLDNLQAPEGVLLEAQQLAAEAFCANRTWFLTNGSTAGVLAALLATCRPGDQVIVPRNCHQSVISGLILAGAIPVFVYPEYDAVCDLAHCITPAAVTAALQHHPQAKAVFMLSPTYYGVCGDVAGMAQICHDADLPLIVDEAHGPHFACHPDLPTAALTAGADLVVQSTHKVLSALTQAAMLHSQGDRVDWERVNKSLNLVQSTSPSYLLLASLDAARHQMATEGHRLMQQTLALAKLARSQVEQIAGLSILQLDGAITPGFVDLDLTRLTVTVSGLGLDGFTADQLLCQRFGVVAELPCLRHLTFMISLGNTEADIERLVKGLQALAADQRSSQAVDCFPAITAPLPISTWGCPPRAAFFAPTKLLPIEQTIRCICAELVCPYPPGIPVLMPGEVVTEAAIAYLQTIEQAGARITGCLDGSLRQLQVLANPCREDWPPGV